LTKIGEVREWALKRWALELRKSEAESLGLPAPRAVAKAAPEPITLAEALDDYMQSKRIEGKRPGSIERLAYVKAALLRHFATRDDPNGLSILRADIDAEKIADFRENRIAYKGQGRKLEDGAKPPTMKVKGQASAATVNYDLAVLGAAGRLALEEGKIDRLPWKKKIGRKSNMNGSPVKRFIEPRDMARLLAAARGETGIEIEIVRLNGRPMRGGFPFKTDLYPRLLFMALTGARTGEVERLQWKDIDLGKRSIHLLQTKAARNGSPSKDVFVPMHPDLAKLFGSMERGAADALVFGPDPNLPRRLRALARRVGLDKWEDGSPRAIRRHDFRHFFGSAMASNGTPILTISKLLGHSSIRTTQIYADIATEAKVEAVAGIALEAPEAARVEAIAKVG
jgi:integrase